MRTIDKDWFGMFSTRGAPPAAAADRARQSAIGLDDASGIKSLIRSAT
jgi:hypothetical protein